MIGIKVCRNNTIPSQCSDADPGLNWGDDISEVLLVTEEVALERGRVEIDKAYSNRVNSNLAIAPRTFTQPGSFVGINDEGVIQGGMLKAIKLSLTKNGDNFTTSTEMTVERNL
ncbi:MAG: hypothetical protein GY797_18225 [Deltaproteobacteria bacterium]|nr:hypothetical protein [Deltaproteobacteria bacterium]